MDSKYYKILKTITKDLKKKDAGIININIEKLALDFQLISIYLEKYITIVADDELTNNQKILIFKKIGFNKNSFTKDQAKKLFDVLNITSRTKMKGGSNVPIEIIVKDKIHGGGKKKNPIKKSKPKGKKGKKGKKEKKESKFYFLYFFLS